MVAKTRPSKMEDAPDFPRNDLYLCGFIGVWTGNEATGHFLGNVGCQRRVPKNQYDFWARMCLGCRNAMCAEFEVPQSSCGALEAAIRGLHRYTAVMPGLAEVSRREAVRMLVIASQGEVTGATDREQAGAVKIVAQIPVMREFWPQASKQALTDAIGKMPTRPVRPELTRRLPPQLEALASTGAVA